jgi:hypothetical protein
MMLRLRMSKELEAEAKQVLDPATRDRVVPILFQVELGEKKKGPGTSATAPGQIE